MYVCLCHAVTEEELRIQIAAGATMQDLQENLRAGTCCGCCVDDIVGLLPEGADGNPAIKPLGRAA